MPHKRKLIYGVGTNDMPVGYSGSKLYGRWKVMLSRAYCPKLHERRPSYRDTTVCEEWHTLSNFVEWAESHEWEGRYLDKDILCPGNQVYSPDKCLFVSRDLNNLLCDSAQNRGDCPKGVFYATNQGGKNGKKKYGVEMHAYGKKTRLGYYQTAEEAHRVYCEAKSAHIREVAENLTDVDATDIERTRAGLLEHAEIEGNRWRESVGVFADSEG